MRKNNVEQFLVVNIPTSASEGEISAWKQKINFFVAESCARILLVLPEAQSSEIPNNIMDMSDGKYQGMEAYEKLLRIYCGIEAKKTFDNNIPGQINNRWKKFCQQRPEKATNLQSLISSIQEDHRKIRRSIIEKDISPEEKFDLAKRACRNCALARKDDKVPLDAFLQLPEEQFMRQLNLSRSGTQDIEI